MLGWTTITPSRSNTRLVSTHLVCADWVAIAGEDEKLDWHMDEAEVTLNVCLGKAFEGGAVFFNGLRDTDTERVEDFEFNHTPGLSIIHIGQHWHGARKIRSGERHNIILWSRSTDYHRSTLEQFNTHCNAAGANTNSLNHEEL